MSRERVRTYEFTENYGAATSSAMMVVCHRAIVEIDGRT